MVFEKFVSGYLGNNSYFFPEKEVLIDAPTGILDLISADKIKKIFLTHGHFDHTDGLLDLIKENPKIQVFISEDEREFIANHTSDLFKKIEWKIYPEEILGFKIIKTPGHTPGGVCLLDNHNLFSGDTLFKGTWGRTDLFGGDEKVILETLKILLKFPEETKVFPGHGDETTIREERGLLQNN